MSSPSVSREFAQAVFDYLAELGHPAKSVLQAAEISSARLLASERIPLALYERLFDAGEALTADPCFGINMGAHPYPHSWGLVSHLAVAAPNAMTAVSALMDYSELQLNFIKFSLRELEDNTRCLELQHGSKRPFNRHVVEHLLANVTVLAGTQIGYAVPSLEIELAHNHQQSATAFNSTIQASTILGADAYRVRVDPGFLQQRSLYGEEDVYRITEGLARERLMKLRGEDPFTHKVRETVLLQLPLGLPKIASVASVLDMSARTLQRRLRERNLRFQKVLDEVRSELAMQLIRDSSLDLNDIADYLGFNDQSAFQHAFKRWQGVTPGAFRHSATTTSTQHSVATAQNIG